MNPFWLCVIMTLLWSVMNLLYYSMVVFWYINWVNYMLCVCSAFHSMVFINCIAISLSLWIEWLIILFMMLHWMDMN